MKDILPALRVETRRVAVRSTDWLGCTGLFGLTREPLIEALGRNGRMP